MELRTMRVCNLPLAFVLVAVASMEAQNVPFVLPWNDSAPGVTDLSALNNPISTDRVGADTNGHFLVRGSRVRFLGVNLAGDSPFMPTNKAESVAGRLAKFGVNAVRLHHMDASWAYNGGILSYTATSSTNLNAAQLERVHFLVSRLKNHGIYSDINLLVGREYRSGDGLGPEVISMDWKDAHILGFFYGPALALHKDYARKLLTPVNRFTGLSLAKDPAVAFVEIINENGIIQKWLDGGLDRLPSRYMTNLQSRWNQWLAAKYTDDATLLAAWHAIDAPLGANMLRNGTFTNSLNYWNPELHNLAKASFIRTYDFTNGLPSAKINVTNADSVSWYVQFNQANLKLTSNAVYTLSFSAKASTATNIDASVMRAHTDYSALGYSQGLNLTTNWQTFSASFQASATETNARVNFGGMGNKPVSFWYADVRLQAGGKLGTLPSGTSLASRTVPNVAYTGQGFTGSHDARLDWVAFLRDLETSYYDEMVSYLRTNIGYTGLVFGTIMANSPATVQSRLDVIDGHAYWQHPQFPGQPWDSVNWYQPNISMVNTLGDDNTLAGLARQRLYGKPFTVTEYQHPSPNYYGAEGPLLLAAYGALQDWDGLWFFDYGQGNDVVPMGYVPGYFSMAQHPGKMANLLLAANLFRRGDLQIANQAITMVLNPQRELDYLLNASAWSIFSGSQLGVPGKLAFVNRLNTYVGSDATVPGAPSAPAGNLMTSDTGQLKWNLTQPGKGLVTFDAPRTKGLVGFADNQMVSLSGLKLQPGKTELGWCSLAATLTRGTTFTNDCTMLVVASGWTENTGQVWKDANKDSIGNKWGQAPVLTEVVPFTLTLPVGTNYLKVWTLNTTGQRLAELPISGDATSTVLTVTTNTGTIWYEIQVAPRFAQFDSWRQQYFSATELLDPAISGEAAAPDGDRVPNLLKYYLGLPGRVPAAGNRIPSATLLDLGNSRFLSLSYLHDKSAADVDCAGEVSSDCRLWNFGTGFTEEQRVDLGLLEQVTVRDLTPLDAANSRFMRLRLTRR
jgi:hypothetical protein